MLRLFCRRFGASHCAGGCLMEDTGEECVRACGSGEEKSVWGFVL